MSFDGYEKNLIQKLKLAVSIAIIQTKPDNLTIEEHIEELKSNIYNKMDTDLDISICSDDFNLDFCSNSQKEHNDNDLTRNNSPIIINSNIFKDSFNTNIQQDMINNNTANTVNTVTEINNKHPESVDNNSVTYNNISNNGKKSNKDDNTQCISEIVDNNTENNNSKLTTNIINTNNITNEENDNTEVIQDYYDIVFDDNDMTMINNNITMINNDREDLNKSPTVLQDFDVTLHGNLIENCLNIFEDSTIEKYALNTNEKNVSQDILNIDLTQCSNITYFETQDKKDQNDVTQLTNNSMKSIKNSATNNNLKHTINEEDVRNPKKKRNLEMETETPNIDPNAKFRSNITKFLENNKMATKTIDKTDLLNKTQVDKYKTKEVTNIIEINEYTQNTSHYSQSQPLFLIDQKYIYENKNQIIDSKKSTVKNPAHNEHNINATKKNDEVTKHFNCNYKKVQIDSKLTDVQPKPTIHNYKEAKIVQEKDVYIKNVAQEKIHETNKTKTVINNDVDLNFQGEIYLFSDNLTNDSDLTNFENGNTTNDNTQALFNNITKTNNLKHNTEGAIENNNENNTKDVKNNTSRIDVKTNEINLRNKDIFQEITNNSLRESYSENNIENQADTINTKSLITDIPTNNIININENELKTTEIDNLNTQSLKPNEYLSEDVQIIERQNSSDIEYENELIPFKVIEELNKVKVYLNKVDAKSIEGSSSDTGYKSDSQSRNSLKSTQSYVWLNQSAHSLFTFLSTCPLVHNTQDITRDISMVLGQLIDKLHDNEQYPTFLEELLEATDLLIKLLYEDNIEENQLLKKDENVQRILLLTKSTHIQKFIIEKITATLEKLLQILTSKDSMQEIRSIQIIENSCYIFHILYITLQKYYKNLGKQLISQKTQYSSQLSEYSSQKYQNSSHKSLTSSHLSSQNSQNSQTIRKTDISDIWRKKWNPNFKEISNEDCVETKCVLTECNKVLNSIIVNCMDGYSLIAYFALKCFNLMQS